MQDETSTMWETGAGRRWRMLATAAGAEAASCSFLYGIPFLVPALRTELGLSLAHAGLLVAAPSVGLMLTLIGWGALVDAIGERVVLAVGLMASAALIATAALAPLPLPLLFAVLLFAGACAGSVPAASGRVVLGWFPASSRGLAMGIRQTAQPIGVGVAALGLPPLAQAWGLTIALLLPACLVLAGGVAVALLIVDPPRHQQQSFSLVEGRARSPYRSSTLWRVHGASAMLVVPQFAVSAFAPVYLVSAHGWSPVAAGWFLAVVHGLGALGRLAAGRWSDLAGSRLRPLRVIAVASAAVMLLLALGDVSVPWLATLALLLAGIITVSDNGLGFTASAELAGLSWAGRAMGVQNTAQNLAAAATPPALGLLIGATGYATAYCVAAAFPVIAVALVPVRGSRRRVVSA